MFNVIIFGPPGSGKGTQSARIIDKYKLKHLSTGDLLRAEKYSSSELGNQIAKLIDKGNLVPDEMVQQMVEDFVAKHYKSVRGFIFDGFPRTANQAAWLKQMLLKHDTKINILLCLNVGDNELTQRIIERGKQSGRKDDQNESIVKTRIQVYHTKTKHVLDFYKQMGKYREVNGSGNMDDIFGRICKVIDAETDNL